MTALASAYGWLWLSPRSFGCPGELDKVRFDLYQVLNKERKIPFTSLLWETVPGRWGAAQGLDASLWEGNKGLVGV